MSSDQPSWRQMARTLESLDGVTLESGSADQGLPCYRYRNHDTGVEACFRGYLAARQHDWEKAAAIFGAPIPSIDDYPKTARMLIRRAAAEGLIRGGNALTAQAVLDSIRLDMPSAEDKAYLDYLYTPEAQDIIARNYYRPIDPAVAAKYADVFPKVDLVTVDKDFGGWQAAQKTYFGDGGVFDTIFAATKR